MPFTYIRANNIFKLLLEDIYTETDYIYTFKPIDKIVDLNLQRIIYSKPSYYYKIYISDKMGQNIFNFNNNHIELFNLILQIKHGINMDVNLDFIINDNKSKILITYIYFMKNNLHKMIDIYESIDTKFNDIFEEIMYIFLGNKILTNILFTIE